MHKGEPRGGRDMELTLGHQSVVRGYLALLQPDLDQLVEGFYLGLTGLHVDVISNEGNCDGPLVESFCVCPYEIEPTAPVDQAVSANHEAVSQVVKSTSLLLIPLHGYHHVGTLGLRSAVACCSMTDHHKRNRQCVPVQGLRRGCRLPHSSCDYLRTV